MLRPGRLRLAAAAARRSRLTTAADGAVLSLPVSHIVRVTDGRRLAAHNRVVSAGDVASWRDSTLPLLVRFELHSLQWLGDGNLTPDDRARVVQAWVVEWPIGEQPAWNPYVVATRLMTLAKLMQSGAWPVDDRESLARLIAKHSAFVRHSVEWDLGGNHLWRCACALTVGGAVVGGDDAARQLTAGAALVDRVIQEQVLRDGGHSERSAWYHVAALNDLLDAYLAARRALGPREEAWRSTLRRMLAWTAALRSSAGRLPLFNDSVEFAGAAAQEALEQAFLHRLVGEGDLPRRGLCSLEDTGYYRVDLEGLTLFADFGIPGDFGCPAHAHADLFTFEICDEDGPVVVDAGVPTYSAGRDRHYCRSTAAHNTLEVDGQDQLEVWGAFRVGRWAAPRDVSLQAAPSSGALTGVHNGYRHLAGAPRHRRRLAWDKEERRLDIYDELAGAGAHRAVRRLRFARRCRVEASDNNLRVSTERHVLHLTTDGQWDLKQEVWWPSWGIAEPAVVAAVAVETRLPWNGCITARWVPNPS